LGVCWILAVLLVQIQAEHPSPQRKVSGILDTILGDSRQLLAKHFFTKADVYFHSGYYPTVFDQALASKPASHSPAAQSGEGPCPADFGGQPRDWIDAFGRHFYPSEHTHLGEGRSGAGTEREILPWLRLSLELAPDHIETYTLAAYWLDRRLKKPEQAEQVLRDGLAANPGHPELLFELGRVIYSNQKTSERARNLWESSWRRWQQLEANGQKPERITAEKTLASLGELEERAGNLPRAIEWQTQLKAFSPYPDLIQQNIDRLKARLATNSPAPPKP
jgi:tetratricopeptide (TPR) repeat protein